MARLFSFLDFRTCLVALAIMLASPLMAQDGQEKQAEIDALRARVAELRRHETEIQSRIAEVGGTDTTKQGIINANVNKRLADHQITQLHRVVDAYVSSVDEMEQMQRQVATDIDKRIEMANQSIGSTVKNEALDFAGGTGLEYLLATETGPLLSIGIKLIDKAGRAVIADINEDRLREMVLAERKHLNDVMEVIVRLQNESAGEIRRIHELQNLQGQFRENLDALATAQHQLDTLTGKAHREANLERETDAAGDAAELRKTRGMRIRLCDPRERHQPTGIHLSRKSAGPSVKMSDEKTDKSVAEGEACVDITGFWSFTTTIQMGERKVSTPTVFVEIAPGDDAEVTTYEFFPANKNKVTNKAMPVMRCSLNGHTLNCQRRAQPQVCPPDKYVWESMDMNIAEDVSSITGEFQQTQTFDMNADPSGCTLTHFAGLGKLAYRFEPADDTPSTALKTKASTVK